MRKFYQSTLPYWVAGMLAYGIVLVRRLDDPGRKSYPPKFGDLVEMATANPIPWAIGFAALAYIFFLWHPQTSLQRGFGCLVGAVFFIAPMFQSHRAPQEYFNSHHFPLDCASTSMCMVLALVIPLLLRAYSHRRLWRMRSGETLNLPQDCSRIERFSIWDIMFATTCFALLTASASATSVGTSSYERQEMFHAIPVVITVSITIYLRLRLVSGEGRRSWPLWLAIAIVVLIGSLVKPLVERNEFMIEFDRYFSSTHYLVVVAFLVVVQAMSSLLFVALLDRLGFRYGSLVEHDRENGR